MNDEQLPATIEEKAGVLGVEKRTKAIQDLMTKYKLSEVEINYWLSYLPPEVILDDTDRFQIETDRFLHEVIQLPVESLAKAQDHGEYAIDPLTGKLERFFTCPECNTKGFQSKILTGGVELNKFNRLNELCDECMRKSFVDLRADIQITRAELRDLMNRETELLFLRTQICPVCHKHYTPKYKTKEEAPEETIWREQHISGICSQACWDKIFPDKKGVSSE